uniref:Uncharacterized protein n=1 Tax=Oryza meridionalis TaxID=40149 RepID=A0A0E0C0U7_9ORYZ
MQGQAEGRTKAGDRMDRSRRRPAIFPTVFIPSWPRVMTTWYQPLTMVSDTERVLRITWAQPSSSTPAAPTPLVGIAKELIADVLELKAMLKESNASKEVEDGRTAEGGSGGPGSHGASCCAINLDVPAGGLLGRARDGNTAEDRGGHDEDTASGGAIVSVSSIRGCFASSHVLAVGLAGSTIAEDNGDLQTVLV